VRVHQKGGAHVVLVFIDPGQGSFADGNDAVAPSFALPDGDDSLRVADRSDLQAHEFGPAHAGRIEHFHHGPVTDA